MKSLDKKKLYQIHLIFILTITIIISILLLIFFFLNAGEIASAKAVRNDLNTILLGVSLIFSIFLLLISYYNYKDYLKNVTLNSFGENYINLNFYKHGFKNIFNTNIYNLKIYNNKLEVEDKRTNETKVYKIDSAIFSLKEGFFRYYLEILVNNETISYSLKVDKNSIENSNLKQLLENNLNKNQVVWEI